MSKPDGGAAFPLPFSPATLTHDGHMRVMTPFVPANPGMTLRDYFAAAALQQGIGPRMTTPVSGEELAERAYRVADAMLVEREKA